MKNLLILSCSLFFFVSCEKWDGFHKKDKPCPVVNAADVPASVTKSFDTKYSGAVVDTWFNKDNAGFVASFKQAGKKTIARFDNDGNFENEINQDGDHQDNNEEGCDCETEDND